MWVENITELHNLLGKSERTYFCGMVPDMLKFSQKKIKPKFLTFPIGCESYFQVRDFGISCVFYYLYCILVMKGQEDFCMNSASRSYTSLDWEEF